MSPDAESPPRLTDGPDRAVAELLARTKTLTLATASAAGPWAAAVYYVRRADRLYFFSDPTSRHITEALTAGQAAGSIHARAEGWRDISGLQLTGRIRPVGPGREAIRAVTAYLTKFPFVREFFSPGRLIDLAEFEKSFRSKLYCFQIEQALYMDNRIKLGHRAEMDLSGEND